MAIERSENLSEEVTEGRSSVRAEPLNERLDREQLTEVHAGGLRGLKCVICE